MSHIQNIDKFSAEFPSKYGLYADGSCYEVLADLYLDCLLSYKENTSQKYGKYLEPIWLSVKIYPGDILMVSKNGSYIKFKDFQGFVECKPSQKTKPGKPPMLAYNSIYFKKLGKDIIKSKPMSFEDREKIKSERGLI